MPLVTTPPAISERGQDALNSVAQRWTPALVEGVPGIRGFVPVVRSFLRAYHLLGLTPAQAVFVIHLLDFKRDDAAPYPSYARLARYMGVQPKAVQRCARALESKGLLRRLTRVGEANRFDLRPLFLRLEALMPEAAAAEIARRALPPASPNVADVNSVDGAWKVEAPGASRASGRFPTQHEAVEEAKPMISYCGPGEVRIHNRAGLIREAVVSSAAAMPPTERPVTRRKKKVSPGARAR